MNTYYLQNVEIDGNRQELIYFEVQQELTDRYSNVMIKAAPTYTDALYKMRLNNGIYIEFTSRNALVEPFMSENGEMLRISGLGKQLFPKLFKESNLLPWQIAYLKTRKDVCEYQYGLYGNDHKIFTTREASLFQQGFRAGMKHR